MSDGLKFRDQIFQFAYHVDSSVARRAVAMIVSRSIQVAQSQYVHCENTLPPSGEGVVKADIQVLRNTFFLRIGPPPTPLVTLIALNRTPS